jgi:hypothetical protein
MLRLQHSYIGIYYYTVDNTNFQTILLSMKSVFAAIMLNKNVNCFFVTKLARCDVSLNGYLFSFKKS